jgi:hypothetical protein
VGEAAAFVVVEDSGEVDGAAAETGEYRHRKSVFRSFVY